MFLCDYILKWLTVGSEVQCGHPVNDDNDDDKDANANSSSSSNADKDGDKGAGKVQKALFKQRSNDTLLERMPADFQVWRPFLKLIF
jgi:hypothetical protein